MRNEVKHRAVWETQTPVCPVWEKCECTHGCGSLSQTGQSFTSCSFPRIHTAYICHVCSCILVSQTKSYSFPQSLKQQFLGTRSSPTAPGAIRTQQQDWSAGLGGWLLVKPGFGGCPGGKSSHTCTVGDPPVLSRLPN